MQTKRKKRLPTCTFPMSIELLNKYGVSIVMNLLISSAQASAHLCHVQVAIGEARNDIERELGAEFRKILSEMVTPKKSKAKRAVSTSARKHSRGSKP